MLSRKRFSLIILMLLICGLRNASAQAPQAEFSVDDSIVCVGNTVTFTDMSIPGGAAITNWDWNFGDTQTGTGTPITHSYASGGNYTVRLIVTDALNNKDTITHTIYVLLAQAIQHTVRICSPQSSTTIYAVDPGLPGVSGTWFTSSGAVIGSMGNDTTLISNLVSGSYLIFWVVSDGGACSDADQVLITVDQPVTANAGPDLNICSTAGTATMAGSAPAPGTGLWTTTSSATITVPSSRNTTITGLGTPGTYVFVWSVTNGSCVSRDTMQIIVSSPIAANAGSDQTACNTNPTTTLAGNNPSPGTGTWTTTGTASITTPSSATSGVTALANGINTFIWTINNGGCITKDTMIVTVSTVVTSNAGNNIQVCTSTGTGTLNGNNPSPGTGLWTALNGGTITTPSSATTTVTGLSVAGFYNFVWTITNGGCVSKDTVAFIVRAPVIPNAGVDQTFCNTTTTTLTGSNPAPAVASWTTTGSSTIVSPSSATTVINNLSTGNNTFIYTNTYGACVNRDTIIVHVDSLVIANAGPDQQICESNPNTTLAGNNPSPGTGVWTKLNGGTITTPSSPTSTVTGLTAGTHQFVWTITNGTCISRDTMRITVNVQIPAVAGLDDEICQNTTTTLSANNPTPGTGLWTTSSAAIITSPSSSNTAVSGFSNAGIYSFIWTVTNGACVLRDTIRITVDSSIVANAGPDQFICSATTANLSGNNPAPGTGHWTSLGTATIVSANSANTVVNNLAYGNNLFVWRITDGACITRDTINVRRDSLITANAGPDQQICSTTTTATLAGNSAAPGTGLWSTSSTATITTPSSANSGVTGLSGAGVYTFIWTVTNGSCVNRDTMSIAVSQNVIANAGADQNLCGVNSATLAGNIATPGTGLWTTSGSSTITTPSNPASTVTGLTSGDHIYIWTITNGSCITKDTVRIHIDSLIVSSAGPDQQICIGTTAILNANNPSSGTGTWTALNGGTLGNPNSANTTVNAFAATGNYDFVWTITNGTCTSRDTVRITVLAQITANAGIDQSLCNSTSALLNGNSPLPGIGLWTTTSTAIITSPSNASTSITGLSAGSFDFIWTISNGACISSDTVTIVVADSIIADAGSDVEVCSGTVITMSANDPTPGNGLWTALNGGIFSDATSNTSDVSGLINAGDYYFTWTITNGACVSVDTMKITIDSLVIADAGIDQSHCDIFDKTMNANDPTPGTGLWTTTSTSVITDPTDPNTTVTSVPYGTSIFVWTVTNGNCTSSDTITIHVDSLIVANSGSNQSICQTQGSVLIVANDPLPGTGLWTSSNPLITFGDSSSSSTTAIGFLQAGDDTLFWTITNGVCVYADPVVIHVDSNEVADAGPDQQICETNNSSTLAANTPNLGTGLWTTTSTALITDPTDPNTTVTNLVLGSYQFVWEITNGQCVSTDTITIDVAQQVNAADAGIDQSFCSSVTGITVHGNTPSIGTGTWSSTGSAIFTLPNDTIATVSNPDIGQNLMIWTITNGGCSSSDTSVIIIYPNPVADAGVDQFTTSGTPVVIGGITPASGGNPPYVYTWNPAIYLDDSSLANPTATVNITQQFILIVTDSLGCDGTDTMIVYVNNPPDAQNDTITINEDSVVVIAVLLNDTDPDNNINPAAVTILNGPFNGTASVDTLGNITYTPNANYFGNDSIQYAVCDSGIPVYCDTAWIFINILPVNDPPVALDDAVSTVEDSCIQISILLNDSDVENGIVNTSLGILTGPSNGTIAIDTLNGIITYCPDTNFTGIDTLTYVICDNGMPVYCDTALVIITVVPANDPPDALNDSIIICSADTAFINVTGNDTDSENGVLSVTIITSPSNGTASTDTSQQIIYVANSFFNGIDSIAYQVCDDGTPTGCDTAWAYITVHATPQVSAVITNSNCFADSIGAIDITLTGNAPYTYIWNNTEVTEDIDSLPAGPYNVLVTDTFGCIVTLDTIVSGPAAALSAILSMQPVLCHGDSTGAIDLQPTGGTMPYTYLWNTTDTVEDLDSLSAGVYTILLSDSNGCTISYTDSITEPDSALTAILTVTAINCAGDSSGMIALNVSGGTPVYSFLWSDASVAQDLTNAIAGIYTVTITDGFSCSLSLSDTITELNSAITSANTIISPQCIQGMLGSISLSVQGGVAPYSYVWSTTDTVNMIDSLIAGNYDYTVTDSLGCILQSTIILNDSSSIAITNSGNDIFCDGDSVTLNVTSYSGVSYQWYHDNVLLTNDTLTQLNVWQSGDYTVTATAGCGVFNAGPQTITVNLLPLVIVSNDANITCDSTITLTAGGGVNYSWNPASLCETPNNITTTVNPQETTVFTVTVTDINGCSVLDSIHVNVTCDTLFIPEGFSPNGDGVNDYFVISNIERYPDAVLKIFNRWGDLVYKKINYDNSWNGFSNTDFVRMGDELPEGTYFYVFDSGKDEGSQTGYIVMRK